MSSGSHAGRRRNAGRVLVGVAVLVLLGVLIGGLAVVFENRSAPAAEAEGDEPQCRVENLSVAVSPRVQALIRRVLDQLTDDCLRFSVTAEGERQTVDKVFFGGEPPDLWIPDGEWGLAKMPVEVVSRGLASTPVLLVGGSSVARAGTWGQALETGAVVMPDPLTNSVGTLAMMAPRQEAQAAGSDLDQARSFLVPTAQSYGERVAEGRPVDLSLDTLTPTTTRVVAATELAFLKARRGNRALRSVTPRAGAGLMVFPLAVRDDATAAARTAAQEIRRWFDSDEGVAAVREHGLRGPDGAPLGSDAGAGRLRILPDPTSAAVDEYRLTWQVMSVPSSVLAVFDVSGSMDFATPDGSTRIDVAVGAATTALEVFPGHARIGLWAFSVARGPAGQDWQVMEPVRRLDRTVGGQTQRERLGLRARELAGLTDGGTGLYDTTLAAYRQAVADYDPRYSNSVILITDGANDDPGSISGADLLRRLRALVDPQRPVRIIGVGISGDADLAALRRIAAATGGRAHRADTPVDILTVFSREIANR